MSAEGLNWMGQLMAMDTPALPAPWLMHLWLSLGWSVVLACAVAIFGKAWPVRWRMAAAGLVALGCWFAGPYVPTHWLGMAFQSPSITSVLLCAAFLYGAFFRSTQLSPQPADGDLRWSLVFAVLGVVLGWVLLLDTFAVLPLAVYAWGFSPVTAAVVFAVLMAPWICHRGELAMDATLWVAPLAVLAFAALRLPTGNLWDALLDPWLWVALHVYSIRGLLQVSRRSKA
jgi:hypothetical protein